MFFFCCRGNGRIAKASYFTDGCASSQICGSFAAQLTLGKDPDELIDITPEAVFNEIGKLPENDMHCTVLASTAVQEALNDYMTKPKETT